MNSVTKFKVVFAGDQNVGKTSVISRFMFDSYADSSMPTIGIDFLTKTLQVENETVRLQLWDTAGQQRYRALIPSYIKDADACVIVLDVTCKNSFDSIPKWIDFVIQTRGNDTLVFLVANKIDCDNPQVKVQQIEQYAKKNDLIFYKVSAKTGQGIQPLFRSVATKLYEKNNHTQTKVSAVDDTKRIPYPNRNNKVSLGSNNELNKPNDSRCSC